MVEWATVIVSICLAGLVYFLIKGIGLALKGRELPDAEEGDYVIKVVARIGHRGYLAVMSRYERRDKKREVDGP